MIDFAPIGFYQRVMDQIPSLSIARIYANFFGSDVAIAPEYLLVTLLIAFVIYKSRGISTGFWSWATPKDIYRHSSSLLDVKLFILGRIMALLGLINKVVFTTVIAGATAGVFNGNLDNKTLANPILIAAIILLINDIVSYWIHRVYHHTPLFWPIHSVHHSAEVLTPITTYRQHPLALIISAFVHSIFFGALQGVFLGAFVMEFKAAELVGINLFYFGFLMLIHNFHHSHIWISFGRFWGHIFISPAQHQIHHSLSPTHHNKNFGEVLAIWDWVFGTLYVPDKREQISVGIADDHGNKVPQKHTGVLKALITPFADMWAVVASKR